jgi:hypothetical protein
MSLSIRPAVLALALLTGCLPLDGAGDVSGDYTVSYSPGWDIFEDGEQVARVQSGEGAQVQLSEGVLVFDVLCADADATCPDEALWGEVEVAHPLKQETAVIEIINRDPEVGQEGAILGGLVAQDGAFTAVAGADPRCGGLAVGTVSGTFTADGIEEGLVAWSFGQGCTVGALELDGELRIEASFEAALSEADAEDAADELQDAADEAQDGAF